MIHVFIGTKAQLIKMAPILRELQCRNIQYNFIFSGQHQDTIKELRENFGVKEPDFVLHKGKDVTSVLRMGIWLIKIIALSLWNKNSLWKGDRKGVVLNHGDTFSTLAGAILARLGGHKCAHVESGLRSFDYFNPFPEELTRIAVFYLSNIYFCPNEWALNNLTKFSGEKILTNGNTLYDALMTIKNLSPVEELNFPSEKYCIFSVHRFENIFKGKSLHLIVEILEEISEVMCVLVIMHKPTLKKLEDANLLDRLKSNVNIQLRPRYDYLNFISLVSSSEFVVTDGGSNQEECYFLGKPCLLLRRATERPEGLGQNAVLSNFDRDIIKNFVDSYTLYKKNSVLFDPSPTNIIVDSLVAATKGKTL